MTKLIFKNYKFRASQIGKIMSGTGSQGLTEKQQQTLDELLQKEKRTQKQEEYMQELIAKKNAPPEFSKTLISYLKELAIEIETGRVKEIETDPIKKGIELENESIELVNKIYKKSYVKNGKKYENEYVVGTPDIIEVTKEKRFVIRDIKTVKDIFTHPYYDTEIPNTDYFYQLQSYMWLTNAEIAYLDYVLLDAPEWYIQKVLKYKYFEQIDKGMEGEELENFLHEEEIKLRFNLTYFDLPDERKIKTFKIERNDFVIEKIKNQIELIRQFSFEI